jgi:hypothetical protein
VGKGYPDWSKIFYFKISTNPGFPFLFFKIETVIVFVHVVVHVVVLAWPQQRVCASFDAFTLFCRAPFLTPNENCA